MNHIEKFSAFVGSMAILLLLGTNMAHAMQVCLDGDIVTEIKSLDVVTQQYGQISIDVDFNYATGYETYGSDLGDFPFDPTFADNDAQATMLAINDALNGLNPVPTSIGRINQNAYYVGGESETENNVEFVLAIGGENLLGESWDRCDIDCTIGLAILEANARYTYADLSRADGNGCGNAPPPSFPITPGITGAWFDRTRSGEGFNVEIIGSKLDPRFLVYFYTYDANGNQMWLTGKGSVNGDTAVVPMLVTSGTVFGPGFDPDDVVREDWGTITFTFNSCNAGTAEYVSINFGSGTFEIVRLPLGREPSCRT